MVSGPKFPTPITSSGYATDKPKSTQDDIKNGCSRCITMSAHVCGTLTITLLVMLSTVAFTINFSMQNEDVSSEMVVLTGHRTRDWSSANSYSMHSSEEDRYTRLYVCMVSAGITAPNKPAYASLGDFRDKAKLHYDCGAESDGGWPRDYGFLRCLQANFIATFQQSNVFLKCLDLSEGIMVETIQTPASSLFLGSYNFVTLLLASMGVMSAFMLFTAGGMCIEDGLRTDMKRLVTEGKEEWVQSGYTYVAARQGWAPLAALPVALALMWSFVMFVASIIYTFPPKNIWSDTVSVTGGARTLPGTPWTGFMCTGVSVGMFVYFASCLVEWYGDRTERGEQTKFHKRNQQIEEDKQLDIIRKAAAAEDARINLVDASQKVADARREERQAFYAAERIVSERKAAIAKIHGAVKAADFRRVRQGVRDAKPGIQMIINEVTKKAQQAAGMPLPHPSPFSHGKWDVDPTGGVWGSSNLPPPLPLVPMRPTFEPAGGVWGSGSSNPPLPLVPVRPTFEPAGGWGSGSSNLPLPLVPVRPTFEPAGGWGPNSVPPRQVLIPGYALPPVPVLNNPGLKRDPVTGKVIPMMQGVDKKYEGGGHRHPQTLGIRYNPQLHYLDRHTAHLTPLLNKAFALTWVFADGLLFVGMLNGQNSLLNENVVAIWYYIIQCRGFQLAAAYFMDDVLFVDLTDRSVIDFSSKISSMIHAGIAVACSHLSSLWCMVIVLFHFINALSIPLGLNAKGVSNPTQALQISFVVFVVLMEIIRHTFAFLTIFGRFDQKSYLNIIQTIFFFDWLIRFSFIVATLFTVPFDLGDRNMRLFNYIM